MICSNLCWDCTVPWTQELQIARCFVREQHWSPLLACIDEATQSLTILELPPSQGTQRRPHPTPSGPRCFATCSLRIL
eukprot:4310624-Amphidinium_carterae.1